MIHLDAMVGRRWFCATAVGSDGHPYVFIREPSYPLVGLSRLGDLLRGCEVRACDDAWEALDGEGVDLEPGRRVSLGPRRGALAATLAEARVLTFRNVERLRLPTMSPEKWILLP